MPDEPISAGRVLAGRYALTQQLGPGGSTWAAVDQQYNHPVAVREVVAPQTAGPDERLALIARAKWEATQLAQLRDDPHVVTVYDTIEEDGRLWTVMELLPGRDLGRLAAESGPMPVPEAGRIAVAVLGALAAAHALGVTHGSVKPGNIFRCEDGRVVLTGFGAVASFPDAAALAFTDPERLRTGRATFGGDVFSLGATTYYLVEGATPFNRPDPQAQAGAILNEEPPVPQRAGPLGPVLFSLLRKNQAELPTPAVARAQIAAAIGLGVPGVSAVSAVSGQGAPAQPVQAQFAQGQFAPPPPNPAQYGQVPFGTAGLPTSSNQTPPTQLIFWLLTSFASVVALAAAFVGSWGSVTYSSPGSPGQPTTASLFDLIKTGGGGVGDMPFLAYTTWFAPILLPLIGTAVLGVIAAMSTRRLSWLCAGSALLGAAAQIGVYLFLAGIPAVSDFITPSVSLQLSGYVGIAASIAALAFAVAAGAVGRTAPAQGLSVQPFGNQPVGAQPALVGPPKTPLAIAAAISAALTLGSTFLPYLDSPGNSHSTTVSSWQWSQMTILPEACCLVALIVLALIARSPGRNIRTSHLVVPAALAFGAEILMVLQYVGLNQSFLSGDKLSMAFGSWIGLGLTLIGLIVSVLSHNRRSGYTAQPVGLIPGSYQG